MDRFFIVVRGAVVSTSSPQRAANASLNVEAWEIEYTHCNVSLLEWPKEPARSSRQLS